MPEECTQGEVRRFLENIEHNAAMNPDMLALLFATMAQGAQNGVYDKYGERWIAGAMEEEAQRGDVFGMFALAIEHSTLIVSSCCRYASFEDRLLPIATDATNY